MRYRRSQEVRRADTPNQGAFRKQETAPAPCKAQLHGTSRHSVGRWSETVGITAMGVWGLPRRFPVALKALPEPWQVPV